MIEYNYKQKINKMSLFKKKIADDLEKNMIDFFMSIKNNELQINKTKNIIDKFEKAKIGVIVAGGTIGVVTLAMVIATKADIYTVSADIMKIAHGVLIATGGLGSLFFKKFEKSQTHLRELLNQRYTSRSKDFYNFEKGLVEKLNTIGFDINYKGVLDYFEMKKMIDVIQETKSEDDTPIKEKTREFIKKMINAYEEELIEKRTIKLKKPSSP